MNNSMQLQVSPYRWVILAIMWATICVSIIAQFQVSALAYKIIPELNLTSGQYGTVLTAPMIAGILLSFAAGAMADRWGVKRVVAVGFVISTFGAFFRFAADSYLTMFILMFMAGICPGTLNANASKLLGAWFPKEHLGIAMGIFFSATGTGMTVALSTTTMFPTVTSAFVFSGLIMLAVLVLWLTLIKSKPWGAPELPTMPVTRYLGVAARSRNVWLVGLAMMFFMGSSLSFSGFLPNALNDARGMTPSSAGFMTSLITLGTICGSILGPIIFTRINKMKPFLVSAALIGATASFLAWHLPQEAAMPVMFAVLGFFSGMCPPLFLSSPMLLPEIGPVYAGSAGGIIGTLQVVGAVCIPSFIIAPLAGVNYDLFFTLASLCLLTVAVVSLLLPELGPRSSAASEPETVSQSAAQ